jgi:desulfoferrodoxin (superoxide reductase-like protein)
MSKKAFIAAVILLAASSAMASPPNAIHAKYDEGRQELEITVQHMVNDPSAHFIKEIVVYRNGQEVARRSFEFQTSHRSLTVPPIKVPASAGDELRITAECNLSGSGETTIEVKSE